MFFFFFFFFGCLTFPFFFSNEASKWLSGIAENDRQYYESHPGCGGYRPVSVDWLCNPSGVDATEEQLEEQLKARVGVHVEKACAEFRRRFIVCAESSVEEKTGLLLLAYGLPFDASLDFLHGRGKVQLCLLVVDDVVVGDVVVVVVVI